MVENSTQTNHTHGIGAEGIGDGVRRFRRSREDRMVAGVCGGAAKMLGVDVALLRLLLVAATLFGFGFGFGIGAVLYVVSWILVPEDD
jgi:phage shock protein C